MVRLPPINHNVTTALVSKTRFPERALAYVALFLGIAFVCVRLIGDRSLWLAWLGVALALLLVIVFLIIMGRHAWCCFVRITHREPTQKPKNPKEFS
jgi:uncharacterized membrane protein YcjF (UPF0283 family)